MTLSYDRVQLEYLVFVGHNSWYDGDTLCAPFVRLPSVTGAAIVMSKTPVLLLAFPSVQPDDHVDGGGQFAARHAQDTRWRCDNQRGGNIPGIVAF